MLGLGIGSFVEASDFASKGIAGYSNAQSLDLDGTGDYIDPGFTTSTLQTLMRGDQTYSTWIRAPYNASFTVFGYGDTGNGLAPGLLVQYFYLNASIDYFSVTGKASNTSFGQLLVMNPTATNSSNAWIHVAYTVIKGADDSTNGTHSIYINGSLAHSSNTRTKDFHEASVVSAGRNLAIGAYNNNGTASSNITGQMDEVAIWNVALDANAVNEIYNSGVPNDLTVAGTNYTQTMVNGLQRYYRFEGGDLTKDYSTNNTSATLEGNPSASSEVPS